MNRRDFIINSILASIPVASYHFFYARTDEDILKLNDMDESRQLETIRYQIE